MSRITNQLLSTFRQDPSRTPPVLAPFTFDHLTVETRQILHKCALGLLPNMDGIAEEERDKVKFCYHDLMPHPRETQEEFEKRMNEQFGPLPE